MANQKVQPYYFKVKNLSDEEILNFDVFSDIDERVYITYGFKSITFEQFKSSLANGMECVIDKTEIVSNIPYFTNITLSQEFEGIEERENCIALINEKQKNTSYFNNEYLLSLDEDEKLHFSIDVLLPYQELSFFLYPKKIEDRKIVPQEDATDQLSDEKLLKSSPAFEISKIPFNLIVDTDRWLSDFEVFDANANFINGNDKIKFGVPHISYVQFLRNICFDKKEIAKVVIIQPEKYAESKVIYTLRTQDVFGNASVRPVIIDMEKFEAEGGNIFYVGESDHEFILDDMTSMVFNSLQPNTKIVLFPKIKK